MAHVVPYPVFTKRQTKFDNTMINEGKEIGGTHYSDMKIEPIELILALHLNFIQGSIVKYISRYKHKGGVNDLKKALHYCEMAKSEYMYLSQNDDDSEIVIHMYCAANDMSKEEEYAIIQANNLDYGECGHTIKCIIEKLEDKE